MKFLKFLSLAFVFLGVFVACENTEDEAEYDNWQARNVQAYADTLKFAQDAIEVAKAQYGDTWEEHCDWRVLRSYAIADTIASSATNTVVVRIGRRGTGSGCPLFTDSVKVNFIGRLLPSKSYEDGYVFGHSSLYDTYEDVFDPQFAAPVSYKVSNLVEGFTTALMYMHIGDLWRIYVPSEMGYSSTEQTSIPAYSMLRFDVELKAFWRIK